LALGAYNKGVRPFGAIHIFCVVLVVGSAALLAWLCRRGALPSRGLRCGLAGALAANEIVRYLHDGISFPDNLPIHLCTVSTWAAIVACLTLTPLAVEWVYFEGIAGAGMALLTPDLPHKVQVQFWSYDAIRYFLEHGGIVIAAAILVFGRIAPLRPGALLRGNLMFIIGGLCLLLFNRIYGTNYLYLTHKPASHTLLDLMGPWPIYVFVGELVAMTIFGLLWLAARPARDPRRQMGLETCERSA